MIFPKYIYITAHPMPKLRKRRENIADVTTSFEPSFLFAANLIVHIYLVFMFNLRLKLNFETLSCKIPHHKKVCILDKVRCYSTNHISV